jgi:hypothetical protein
MDDLGDIAALIGNLVSIASSMVSELDRDVVGEGQPSSPVIVP